MTGYAVRGHMGFVNKDGDGFDRRLNVRLHSETVGAMVRLKGPDDSLADFVRAAVNEKIHRATKERGE